LILRAHSRVSDGGLSSVLINDLVNKYLATTEALKQTPLGSVLDLLIYLQRPTRKNKEIRNSLTTLINERTCNLSTKGLELYIRRLINIEDTT
jgi:hypothetical protein